MSIFDSPRFLRNVLVADAVSCLATGVAQLAATQPLANLLGLPPALLSATGWFLLAYAALVAFVASRDTRSRAGSCGAFVGGNSAWALACIALPAGGFLAPTAAGVAWLLAQAATVAILADLQWTGLRRCRHAPPA